MSSRISLYGCVLLLLGCGAPSKPSRLVSDPKAAAGNAHSKVELGSLLPAYELARVEPGTYGPISLSLDGGTLSVWATPGPKDRTWYARSIDRDGHASAPAHSIAKADLELGLVTLAPVSQGLRSLLVYSTQASAQTTRLHALLLDSTGTPKSAVTELATTESSLLWIQVVDTPKGPLIVYAISRENLAEIRVLGLTSDGAVRFVDREVAVGLRAWQIVAAPDGATLAVVRAANDGHGGVVSLLLLDRNGAVVKGPIDLDDHATAELDLDLTRVGSNYVVAWSDRRNIDSRILLAAVDASGNLVTKPTPGLAAQGEQTLVKLVTPAKSGRAVLVWENPMLPYSRRILNLAEVDQNAHVGSKIVHLVCSSRSSTLPEIVATEEGLRVLTFDDADGSPASAAADPMPTFIEFGAELTPRAALPLKLEASQGRTAVPLLAWGLDCRHGCRATAALDDNPVTIATIDLADVAKRPRAAERLPALAFTATPTLPRLERLDSIAEVEPLADLDAARRSDGFELATVTYFDSSTPLKRLGKPGPDGRTDPLQARVDVFSVGADGTVQAPQAISYRATSLPGLSLAASANPSEAAAVAWSAHEQGHPQLFVSLVGRDSKKQAQRMLTHKRGRLDDIAITTVDDGWLLAWMDERSNELELYATRVTNGLERRGNEQRLTNRPGDLSALALASVGSEGIVVYAAAPKGAKKRGVELFSRRISAKDAEPREPAHRVIELAGAVKFLSATRFGDGLMLGWLEIPVDSGLGDQDAALRFLQLDAKGLPLSQPMTLTLADAVPATLALECPNRTCHGVVVADVGGRGELRAFTLDPATATPIRPVPLARSLGTVEQNVAPVLAGEHVFMVDQIDAERTRIVHARLLWQ